MSELYDRLSALSPQQRALLEARLKQKGLRLPKTQAIVKRTAPGPLPLSIDQEQLWIADQIDPCNPAYNISTAMRLTGRLDITAIERAINEIARRHDALRTTFQAADGRPAQVVAQSLNVPLPVTDISQATSLPQEVMRLTAAEASRPFDLSRGPLIRARMLRLSEDEHALVVVMHHIIADSWSFGVFNQELLALYDAYAAGRTSPLAELPIQYSDYAIWQREWLSGDLLEEKIAHWKRLLADAPMVFDLPTDRPRPAAQSYRGESRFLTISEDLMRALKELANRERATMFMTMLAAFNVLLFRYSNQRDILIGSPIANRNQPEIQNLIGYFLNMLVLRTRLRPDMTMRDLLAHSRESLLAAYAHQDLPFARLVQELQPQRDLAQNPLFQVCFVYLDFQEPEAELQGLKLSEMKVDTGTAMFDLTLALTENADGLDGHFEYASDLFNSETIERMIGHFKNLLVSIASNTDSKLCDLSLLDQQERQQVLGQNKPRASFALNSTLSQLFHHQAATRPHAIALTCADQHLSYSLLDHRSNQLARYLQSMGVAPDEVVALMFDRCPDMIVAMLAILKAGAAYLPLDSSSPPARLEAMLKDASVKKVISQQPLHSLVKQAAEAARCYLILTDTDSPAISKLNPGPLNCTALLDNLAYVIYTSGSTGTPKGVAITHANLARLFMATQLHFSFDHQDVWSVFHSFAFDFSVWEVWGGLLHGGRIVIVDEPVRRSPELFYDLIDTQGVTVLNQTPTAFYEIDSLEQRTSGRRLKSLRVVILGGEALEMRRLRAWIDRHGDLNPQLVNMYGITETTVHVTYKRIKLEDVISQNKSLIGKALTDLQVYVLDESMEVVGIGMKGEMFVAGEGLGRGYIGAAAQTAQRMLPDPYSSEKGKRMYRSGDMGSIAESMELEYEGRNDEQVKVRGYRIELGEVAAAAEQMEGVKQAVVVGRAEADGATRLVAYLVSAQPIPPSQDELRGFLRKRLPDHMIPSAFVFIDTIPMTANGKVDRRALPAPGSARPNLEVGYYAPQNALEELLAQLWQEVLGIDRVGTQDDFFALGGNSIKGAVFINRLQASLGEIVHVVAIFNAPTIAQLCVYLNEHYRDAVAKILDEPEQPAGKMSSDQVAGETETLDATVVAEMRGLIKPLAPRRASDQANSKNPQTIFVLAPPRSGTTLLRVMMGGHPQLFAPPELELMSFNTLAEQRAAFSGKNSFWREGTIRAIMQVKDCDADRARAIIDECADQQMTTQQFYRLLQEWIGASRLVDKTPSYSLDKTILERIENDFENPLYVHLTRHPAGMIHSFNECRLEQILFQPMHRFSRRQLAELIWLISHQNIIEFLQQIPQERKHAIKFEDLVSQPQIIMERLCGFLSLDFCPDMLKVYENRAVKMVDGMHAESRMLGDVKFDTHRDIDASIAERWKGAIAEEGLSPLTQQVAYALSYTMHGGRERIQLPTEPTPSESAHQNCSPLLLIQQGDHRPPFFCAHPVAGAAAHYAHLARELGAKQAFYGLQGLDPDEPYIDLEERAARLVNAVREVQPRGPYLLGGWSFGGLVAFEMAQQLHDRGEPVALLALLDPMKPRGGDGRVIAVNSEPEDLFDLIQQIGNLTGWRYGGLRAEVSDMDHNEQQRYLHNKLRESHLLPPELSPAEVTDWLRALKDKLRTALNYKPRTYAGKITLFRPEEQLHQHRHAQESFLGLDLTGDWGRLCLNPIEVHIVPGSHHTMVVQPHARALAAKLGACIREAINSNFSNAML